MTKVREIVAAAYALIGRKGYAVYAAYTFVVMTETLLSKVLALLRRS